MLKHQAVLDHSARVPCISGHLVIHRPIRPSTVEVIGDKWSTERSALSILFESSLCNILFFRFTDFYVAFFSINFCLSCSQSDKCDETTIRPPRLVIVLLRVVVISFASMSNCESTNSGTTNEMLLEPYCQYH